MRPSLDENVDSILLSAAARIIPAANCAGRPGGQAPGSRRTLIDSWAAVFRNPSSHAVIGSTSEIIGSACTRPSAKNWRARGHDASERSEEHTSELQSRLHLVCRLLLEKKKTD